MPTNKKIETIAKTLNHFLSQGGNLHEAETAVREFNTLIKKNVKDNTAIISSAYPLDDTQKTLIQDLLAKSYGTNLNFEYQVNPSLLAGMKIQIRDYIIDMTLDSTLKAMAENLRS